MKQGYAVLLAMILCLTGCATGTEPEVTAAEPLPAIVDETEPVNIPKGTATKEDCALCGDCSIWGYYSKLDSIGVLNLASGDINDLWIFEYEDDGTRRDNSGHSSMMIANDGDERYSHMTEVIF